MVTSPTTLPAPCVHAARVRTPRPRVHHLLNAGGVALCGQVPPACGVSCVGPWDGGDRCDRCGGPYCATCLRHAHEAAR